MLRWSWWLWEIAKHFWKLTDPILFLILDLGLITSILIFTLLSIGFNSFTAVYTQWSMFWWNLQVVRILISTSRKSEWSCPISIRVPLSILLCSHCWTSRKNYSICWRFRTTLYMVDFIGVKGKVCNVYCFLYCRFALDIDLDAPKIRVPINLLLQVPLYQYLHTHLHLYVV